LKRGVASGAAQRGQQRLAASRPRTAAAPLRRVNCGSRPCELGPCLRAQAGLLWHASFAARPSLVGARKQRLAGGLLVSTVPTVLLYHASVPGPRLGAWSARARGAPAPQRCFNGRQYRIHLGLRVDGPCSREWRLRVSEVRASQLTRQRRPSRAPRALTLRAARVAVHETVVHRHLEARGAALLLEAEHGDLVAELELQRLHMRRAGVSVSAAPGALRSESYVLEPEEE
jgi:hypothetical protein